MNKIYAYELPGVSDKKGLIKVGQTTRDVDKRIKEQIGASHLTYNKIFEESAVDANGNEFSDHDVHRVLKVLRLNNPYGEWFNCVLSDIQAAYGSLVNCKTITPTRTCTFPMRPSQEDAVDMTYDYFTKGGNKFLWNAKMRFGKTFAAYKLAEKMEWTRVLVLTYKPAVMDAWEEDLVTHQDFKNWQFDSKKTPTSRDPDKPLVCFGSLQDLLGSDDKGGIKESNEWIHNTKWDCIILDEYHFGAWRDTAKELIDDGYSYNEDDYIKASRIQTDHYLYLSGTPFRALSMDEFGNDQVYNWTYMDEQQAKENWTGPNNPYASLPKMEIHTSTLSPAAKEIAENSEKDSFSLNELFKVKDSVFVHQSAIVGWLNMIRGKVSDVSDVHNKIERPYSHFNLDHTFWLLPGVDSCDAMENLLNSRDEWNQYEIVNASGAKAGIGVRALYPVQNAIGRLSKTITLSCGKLTTGVTVKEWKAIFMLRDTKSPETYFQSIFRVQSPFTSKSTCYVFDFSFNRVLEMVKEMESKSPRSKGASLEQGLDELLRFLPIYATDGVSMEKLDAKGILDAIITKTTSSMLATKWKSNASLNLGDVVLSKILNDQSLLDTICKIVGFRKTKGTEFKKVITSSNVISKLAGIGTPGAKREVDKARKTKEAALKEIREKLLKFMSRIPVFMYLTSYREEELVDVIRHLHPGLFTEVTGLSVADFNKLVKCGVFNAKVINDSIWTFRMYEEGSLGPYGLGKIVNKRKRMKKKRGKKANNKCHEKAR